MSMQTLVLSSSGVGVAHVRNNRIITPITTNPNPATTAPAILIADLGLST